MKDTKLILITGMSGSGKSTIAQQISRQLTMNNVKNTWLHEEIAEHPIRSEEFCCGDLKYERDMDINCDLMVRKWEKLTKQIAASNSVYILEGCLYQNIIRYFLDAKYSVDKITYFYDRVMRAIALVNPVLIYLRPQNVKTTLENVYPVRGDWWKELILKPEYDGYFRYHPYDGEESIYRMYEYYLKLSDLQYERYRGCKIKFDTSKRDWVGCMQSIMALLGLPYQREKSVWQPHSLEPFLGKYEVTINGNKHSIQIFDENGQLYCKSFWPYMKLIPIDEGLFEIASFPITLRFVQNSCRRLLEVDGNYDWEIAGATMEHVARD